MLMASFFTNLSDIEDLLTASWVNITIFEAPFHLPETILGVLAQYHYINGFQKTIKIQNFPNFEDQSYLHSFGSLFFCNHGREVQRRRESLFQIDSTGPTGVQYHVRDVSAWLTQVDAMSVMCQIGRHGLTIIGCISPKSLQLFLSYIICLIFFYKCQRF